MPEFLALLLGFTLGMLAEALGRRYDATHASGTGPGAQRGGRTMNTLKPFDELTDAEVAALTEDQIRHYCDLRCATEGVPLLPLEPGPKPTIASPTPDVTLYECGGFYLEKQADALRLLELINSLPMIQLGYATGDYSRRMVDGALPSEVVNTIGVWTRLGWDRAKVEVLAAKQQQEEWAAREREYNEASKLRSECCSGIFERLESARSNVYHRERILSGFERYLILSDGDRTIAARFLRQAYPSSVDLVSDEDLGLVVPA